MEEKRRGRRKKRKERKRKKNKNRKGDTRSVPPPPDVFPSAKLENNMTPVKGRLGKNTTPISRDPIKLSHKLQMNPQQRQSSFKIPSRANLIHPP